MSLADSVPGVSGGTIAFILGFYDAFIDALHGLFGKDRAARLRALRYLARLGCGWAVGMVACVLVLAQLFEREIYFMSSLFLGLSAAAFPLVIRAEWSVLRGRARYLPLAFLGAGFVVLLTALRSASPVASLQFSALAPQSLGYLFFSGALAITAMVLPGISGSSILLIAGVYLPAIQALRQLFYLDWSVLPGILALSVGILVGIGLSIHALRAALRRYRSQMVYLILGLMAGALYAIVLGPASLTPPQPRVSPQSFDVLGFLLGAALLLGLELLRKRVTTADRESLGSAAGRAGGEAD